MHRSIHNQLDIVSGVAKYDHDFQLQLEFIIGDWPSGKHVRLHNVRLAKASMEMLVGSSILV